MKSKQKADKSYHYISLFSGIGGLDAGLHPLGFSPLFCCEIDPHASKTLENWLKTQRLVCPIYTDVTLLDPVELLEKFEYRPGQLDLLVGGPPCQPFSLIGKRSSLEDERGQLLFEMVRFAKIFLPKAILIEQVRGLLSASGSNGKRGGALEQLIEQLRELGYSVNLLHNKTRHREDFPSRTANLAL